MIHYLKRTEGILLLFQMLTSGIYATGNSVNNDTSEEILTASLEFKLNNHSDMSTLHNINLDHETTTNPITTTGYVRHSVGRGFPLPRFHLTESRWGPFFEGGSDPYNVTAKVGSTVMMDCRIGLLQNKTVTWSHHKEDSFHLLTVGRSTYSRDERITLSFRYPNNFRLQIVYVTRRDQGLYECQVATHPPKVKRVFLKVIAPEVAILDEFGRMVTERYYKAGSDLELICSARQLRGSTSSSEPPLLWKRDDRVLTKGISLNVSETTDSATSSLIIAPLDKHHSGNYTCSVGSLAFSTVVVHVLNGELPAAVHFGNSASGKFTNALVILGSILIIISQR